MPRRPRQRSESVLSALLRGAALLASTLTGLAGLASLATYVLAQVADALSLVRLWLAQRADVRRELPHDLFVDPLDADPVLAFDIQRNPFGRVYLDGMREPKRERDRVARFGRAVAHALDLQHSYVAFRDAHNHVVDERARQAVQRAVALLDGDLRRQLARKRALRAADRHAVSCDLDLYSRRQRDRLATDTRHCFSSPRNDPLPDVAQHLAADLLPPGLLAGHDPLRRAHDRDAQPTIDAWNLALLHVDAHAGLAHALDTRDDTLALGTVAQVNLQHLVWS